ncbi:hypothetical protein [Streptomyces chromofuscus]|uniref:hypothetical protein n=1 Tax=Streptomyces chromofuscus TaxID=42881 RepID=UPI001673CB26|nr:hypothetical protein [Streptomyces chromofuscus]
MARTGENYTTAHAALQRQLGRSARAQDAPATPAPTNDELYLLINQFLHLQGHLRGPAWTEVDKAAYATSRVLLDGLTSLYTGAMLTTVRVRVELTDTAHPCASDRSGELPAYARRPGPLEVEFQIHQHTEGSGAAYGCEFGADLDRLMIVLALYGGAMRVHPLHLTGPDEPSRFQRAPGR